MARLIIGSDRTAKDLSRSLSPPLFFALQLETTFKERLIQIEEIEIANQEALDKHQEELQQYKQAVSGSNLISPNLELLMQYESHNSRQLMEATAKLEEYQATKNQ